jgi:hypothetical protein
MNKDYETYMVSPEIEKAFKLGVPEDLIVLKVKPPENSQGIDNSTEFTSSVHHCTFNTSSTRVNLKSSKCSFEMWYSNEELEFYFVLPNEEEENHYRRQLVGYYDGIKIEEKKLPEEKFMDVELDRYVTGVRLKYKKSPYEPIWSKSKGGDDDKINDPYKPILNEIDSKTNISFMTQIVYKPLPKQIWKYLYGDSLLDYAEQFEDLDEEDEEDGGFSLFGGSNNITDRQIIKAGAESIRERHGKPLFMTEIRLIALADNKQTVKKELDSVVDLFQNTYRGKTDQTLVPMKTKDLEDFLCRSVCREFSEDNNINFNSRKALLLRKLKNKVFSKRPNMITTDDELAGIAHLPNKDSISVTGIDFTQAMVDGTLPPQAKTFKPVTEKEKQDYNYE